MPRLPEIDTERLRLRSWRDDDRPAFADLNADPLVMEHLHAVLSRQESDAIVDRIEAHFELHGFGLWAVESRETARLSGFVGLSIPRFEAHFTPCVEVGWRLSWAVLRARSVQPLRVGATLGRKGKGPMASIQRPRAGSVAARAREPFFSNSLFRTCTRSPGGLI